MKGSFFLCLCFFLWLCPRLFAQAVDSSRHAIGFFGETNTVFAGNGVPSLSTAGVQYNQRIKKNLGYRIILGYGSYNDMPQAAISSINQDTAISRAVNTRVNMVVVGGGVEGQRKFYKRLFFFAGLQIIAGCGSGTEDSRVTDQYNEALVNPLTGVFFPGVGSFSYTESTTAVTMFYVGFTPYFGLKLDFKKICIGTEFKNYVNYRSVKSHNGSTESLTDFDSNNMTQSVFVQYKF